MSAYSFKITSTTSQTLWVMTLGYEYAHWPVDSNHNHKQADASKNRLMQAKACQCKQEHAKLTCVHQNLYNCTILIFFIVICSQYLPQSRWSSNDF